MKMEFRPLTAKEVECRVAMCRKDGLSLLLYKDARVDMRMLDATVGPLNWKRSHELIGDRLYCTVSVWDDEKLQWITKQDVGTESNTEREKGQASDAFKRACFNLGIGRELYTAPFIWIRASDCRIEEDGRGGYRCKDRFRLTQMDVDGGEIVKLEIVNATSGKIVYQMDNAAKIDERMYKALQERCKAAGKSVGAILGGRKPSEISINEFRMLMDSLEATA